MSSALQRLNEAFRSQTGKRIRRRYRRRLSVETLENRRVLASSGVTSPSITGVVFEDNDGNSMPSPGEELENVEVLLYLDDGDGDFDISDDRQVDDDRTDDDGVYCFENLDVDSGYFVYQPAQSAGGSNLTEQVSGLILPGETGLLIDAFITTQSATASPPAPDTDTSSLSFPNENEVIGGERDIIAELDTGDGEVEVAINPFGNRETLRYNSDVGVTGTGTLIWDGEDGSPGDLDLGLDGRDLTQDGANTGIVFQIGSLVAGAEARIRLYQGSTTNFSEEVFTIPVTSGGQADVYEFVNFSRFNGPVSATNVDAIVLTIDSMQSLANNIELATIGANGPKVYNFSNTPEADLSVTKTNERMSTIPGETIRYVIEVENDGPSAVTGARVVDNLPSGLNSVTYTSRVQGDASGNTQDGVGNIDDFVNMAADSSIIYTVDATINPDASGLLSNTVTVEPPDGVTDPDLSNNTATEEDVLAPEVDMIISKRNDRATVVPGESVSYEIVVTNGGPSQVFGAIVEDVFPDEMLNVSYTSTTTGAVDGNTSGDGDIFDSVDMSPGATITYTVIGTVDPDATGMLSNTATVEVPPGTIELDPSNNSDTDTDPYEPQVDLGVTKTNGVSVVMPGDDVVYTITVRNEGPSSALGARVRDFFPTSDLTDISYTSTASVGASGNTPSGSGDIDDVVTMRPGSQITYTADATVLGNASGLLENTVTVDPPSGTTETNPEDNTATDSDMIDPIFDLSIVKTSLDATAVAGRDVTYTIDVRNSGPSDADDVQVTDVFPSDLIDVRFTSEAMGGASGNNSNGSGDIDDRIDLPAGASVVYTAVGRLDSSATGTLSNTARVAAADDLPDDDPSNDTSTVETSIRFEADLTISKTDNQDEFSPGDDVVYTIVVTNEGPSDVQGARVIDDFPIGVRDVSYTSQASGGASGNTNGVDNIDQTVNLPADSSITYTVEATVSGFVIDTVTNTAQVITPDGVVELDEENNTDSDTNTVDIVLRNVKGAVFVDSNQNGERESSEPGIPNVDIALSGMDAFDNPVEREFVTDESGDYSFEQLQPGFYTIRQTQPEGFPDGEPLLGSGAVVEPTVADNVFLDLGLGRITDASDYDFSELRPTFSKRDYLASTDF